MPQYNNDYKVLNIMMSAGGHEERINGIFTATVGFTIDG